MNKLQFAGAALVSIVALSASSLAVAAEGDIFYACALAKGKVIPGKVAVNEYPNCSDGQIIVSWSDGDIPTPQSCPDGEAMTGFGADGVITCASAASSGQPVVVDADGVTIGYLSVNFGPSLFVLTNGGYTLIVNSRSGGVEQWGLRFEALDCQGQALSTYYPGWIGYTTEGYYYLPFDASSYGRYTVLSAYGSDGVCFNLDTPQLKNAQVALPNDPAVTGFTAGPTDGFYPYPLSVERR